MATPNVAAKVLVESKSDKRLECLFAELRDIDLSLFLFIGEYDISPINCWLQKAGKYILLRGA